MTTETSFEDGNLVITRTYEAPREAVFEAWIETSKVQQWWGCADCTAVRSEVEPWVGGQYNHHMTIRGAGEVPGFAILTEYDPPSRLAYRSASLEGPEASMLVTVEFTEHGAGTLVKLTHSGIPDMRVEGDLELREIVREGWTAAFGKLGVFLSTAVTS